MNKNVLVISLAVAVVLILAALLMIMNNQGTDSAPTSLPGAPPPFDTSFDPTAGPL